MIAHSPRFEDALLSDVDVVVIATPPSTRVPFVAAALEAGKHVVCDKPLASNLLEARHLAELATRSDQHAITFFQWRLHRLLRQLRDDVLGGVIGVPRAIQLEFLHGFLAPTSTSWPWRHDPAQAGSGALSDLGVHMADLLCWVTGQSYRVVTARTQIVHSTRALADGCALPANTDDTAQALLESEHGRTSAALFVSRVAWHAHALRVVVHGDKGARVLELNPDTGSGTLSWHEHAGAHRREDTHVPNPYEELALVLDGRDRSDGLATFHDGVRAQAIIDGVLEHTGPRVRD